VIGECPAETPCLHCRETGDVKRIRNDAEAGGKSETLHLDCAPAWFAKMNEMTKGATTGLTIVGDCSKHAKCKLCHGQENVKRIKDNAVANCPVETLHEACAVVYFERKRDMPQF
jgi:hypothetical protein